MKKLLNNNLIKNYIILLIFMTILEIVFRAISNIPILNLAMLRVFVGLNIIALIISFIISWMNKKYSKIFVIFFIFSMHYLYFFPNRF